MPFPAPATEQQELSKAVLTALNRVLAAFDRAIAKLDKLEMCDMDCMEERTALEDVRSEINRIKAAFFPASA